MGDDSGMCNIGAYHRGPMAGRTPNIDKLASEGAIFTDFYAEASPSRYAFYFKAPAVSPLIIFFCRIMVMPISGMRDTTITALI